MAVRLPAEELYDLSRDPYEIKSLVASPDPEHQKILQELRNELDLWMDETNDQGDHLESPDVVEHWTRIMDELYGVPDWYKPLR